MAKILLSSIISDISGSIGNVVFKRSPSGFVAMLKPNSKSKSFLQNNSALGKLRTVIQNWANLNTATKQAWANASLLYPFPDKFGKMVSLNARMFYIKQNAKLYSVTNNYVDIGTIKSTLINLTPVSVNYINTTSIELNVDIVIDGYILLVQAQFLKNSSVNEYRTRREILYNSESPGIKIFNIGTAINTKFPYLVSGNLIRLYVSVMNQHGFTTTSKTITFKKP